MASAKIITWVKEERRDSLLLSVLYILLSLAAGAVAMLLLFGLVFVFALFVCGTALPETYALILAAGLAGILTVFVGIDCLRSERDDMAIIPIWLFREYLHIGPRLIRTAFRNAVRMQRLIALDVNLCADVLSYLATCSKSVGKEDLLRKFPGVTWTRLIAQLRLFEGVLVLRPERSHISLTMALRLELRSLLAWKGTPRVREQEPEPQPVPIDEPEKLSPCDILGVSTTATLAEIKTAYRNRVKECHPDRFANMDETSRELAEEWTKALNSAYHTLVAQQSGSKASR